MAPRDPSTPQLDFPQLVADIIRQLNLTGQVGLLDFLDAVRPVYIVASREGALDFTTALPVFGSAETFFGASINSPASTVVADTGPLPAGDYDVMANLQFNGTLAAAGQTVVLEHRDAANAATLATLISLPITGTALNMTRDLPLTGYEIGLNERLRALSPPSAFVGGISSTIFARRRPTP